MTYLKLFRLDILIIWLITIRSRGNSHSIIKCISYVRKQKVKSLKKYIWCFSTSSTRIKSQANTVPEPPPPSDNIHYDEGNKKSVQKTTITLTTPTPNTKLSQKNQLHNNKNTKSDTCIKTSVTLETPFPVDDNTKVLTSPRERSRSQTQLKLITIELLPQLHSNSTRQEIAEKFSISRTHQNIFEALKLLYPTLKFVTFQGTHIDTIKQFP